MSRGDISSIDLYKHDGIWSFRIGDRIIPLSGDLDELIDGEMMPYMIQSGVFMVLSFDRIIYDSTNQSLRLLWLEMNFIKAIGGRLIYRDEDLELNISIPAEMLMVLGLRADHKRVPKHLFIGIYSPFPIAQTGFSYEEDQHGVSVFKRDM